MASQPTTCILSCEAPKAVGTPHCPPPPQTTTTTTTTITPPPLPSQIQPSPNCRRHCRGVAAPASRHYRPTHWAVMSPSSLAFAASRLLLLHCCLSAVACATQRAMPQDLERQPMLFMDPESDAVV